MADKMDNIRKRLGNFSEMFAKKKERILKNIIEQPIRTVVVVVLGMFLFIFIFLAILRGIDTLLKNNNCNFWNIVRFDGGVEAWFTFYGSFMGVIATVVLGMITLRLDIKFKNSEEITEINKLSLREMRLYDFKRDYRPSVLIKDNDSKRFMIMLIFNKFDLYYEIEIEKVTWANENCEKGLDVTAQSICVKGADEITIYLNFDDVITENIEKTFSYYYRIGCYEPVMMELGRRQRKLKLNLHLKRKVYSSKDNIFVNLEITLENGGYHDGYMILEEKNYLLKIKDSNEQEGMGKCDGK